MCFINNINIIILYLILVHKYYFIYKKGSITNVEVQKKALVNLPPIINKKPIFLSFLSYYKYRAYYYK
jgi:hypothetical protein